MLTLNFQGRQQPPLTAKAQASVNRASSSAQLPPPSLGQRQELVTLSGLVINNLTHISLGMLGVTSSETKLWCAISRSSIKILADHPRTAIRLPPVLFSSSEVQALEKKNPQCNNSLSLSSRDIPHVYHPPRSEAYIYSHGIFHRASPVSPNIRNQIKSLQKKKTPHQKRASVP